MAQSGDFIWLFGENLSETANNNSFYFWDHVVGRDDGIRKYFILRKTPRNVALYESMDQIRRDHVVWRDSLKHLKLYLDADMFFVTLSYRDVRPEQVLGKNLNFRTYSPVVYLQHGTLAIKRMGYTAHSYNNNMFRFIYYNPHIKDVLVDQKQFKDYQLYYGQYHPRYKELVRRTRAREASGNVERQILWFLTWREYLGENRIATDRLIRDIRAVVKNSKLRAHLESSGITLKLCLHPFFDEGKIAVITDHASCELVDVIHPADVDIMDEIVKSEMLITDYSSLGFDFTLLGKPVVLYQPDLESYLCRRELYCSVDELAHHSVTHSASLIDTIVDGPAEVNGFFASRLPSQIDLEYVESGSHIDRMYEYFSAIQRRRISFIGYNFFGVGGTVSATKALAEGLLEKGYAVELLSLKRTGRLIDPPAGLNVKSLYSDRPKRRVERMKRFVFRSKRFFYDIRHDENLKYLIPYAGYGLRRFLRTTRSAVVVSTRESLHAALCAASSPSIKQRAHFFHSSPDVMDQVFPGVVEELRRLPIQRAVFVTEGNRQEIKRHCQYDHYAHYCVIGNALESSRMVARDEITPVEHKNCYRGMYLVRLSDDRINDIANLIGFAEYLRDHSIRDITIDVYGQGDYESRFLDLVYEKGLQEVVIFRGVTRTPSLKLKEYDALVDFSMSHSFGMTYIEGVLNGKMVFCMENPGSREVMEGIPDCFIESHADLVRKMRSLSDTPLEQLQSNYDTLLARYSRAAVADRFLDCLEPDIRMPG